MAEERTLTEDQRNAVDFITKMIEATLDRTAGVVILRIGKNGHVDTYAGSTVLNPPDLIQRIAQDLARVAQDLFIQALAKGNACTCPKCSQARDTAPMFGGPTAQA